MKLYHTLFFTLVFFTYSQEPIESLQEKNIQSDIDFLASNYTGISPTLKALITKPEILAELAQESQVLLTQDIPDSELEQKAQDTAQKISRKFTISNQYQKELSQLLLRTIKPEIAAFNRDIPNAQYNQLYKNFMSLLETKKTPAGTTLKDWALRFLTSQAVSTALSILEKQENISTLTKLMTERFMTNLTALQDKFSLTLPDNLDKALEERLAYFFKEKFNI